MWYPYYTIRFQDDDRGRWVVEIQGEYAPTAAVVNIEAGDNPLEWKGDGDAKQSECILGATGTLALRITEETRQYMSIGRLLPESALSRRVVARREDVVVWVGFIQPQSFNQAWEAAPYDVSLSLMDMVSALSYIYMDEYETASTILEMLYSAYRRVGGEASATDFLRSNVKKYVPRPGNIGAGSWGSGEVFPEFWNTNPDEKVSYHDVLDTLLSPHGRLFQTGATWFVGRDDILSSSIYRPDDAEESLLVPVNGGVEVTDISYAVAGNGNTQNTVTPPSKVTQSYTPEEGTINLSGDEIFKFSENLIVSDAVTRITTDEWPRSTGEILRYLYLGGVDGNFTHRNFTRYHRAQGIWTSEWDEENTHIGKGWAQILAKESGTNYSVKEVLSLCGRREFTKYEENDKIYRYSVDEIAITTPVFAATGSAIRIQGNATLSDAETSAKVEEWLTNIDASIRVYFGTSPGAKEWVDLPGMNGGWFRVDDPLKPPNSPDLDISELKDDYGIDIPAGYRSGYITLELCACNKSGFLGEVQDWGKLNADILINDISLSYREIHWDPRRPLQWNTGAYNTSTDTINGGVDDIDLVFKTLAGATPDTSTYFTPRRGFDDGDKYVSDPREMIDIEAVQVTTAEGIPGITRFSLFQFNGKTYFPAAVGMNARDNTVSLKLIRTIQ